MMDAERVAETMHEMVLADFATPATTPDYPSKPLWVQVGGCGTELWLDTGDLDAARDLWCAEFTALTTNNTLLNREVQKGLYDELISRVAGSLRGRVPDDQMVIELAFFLNAYHALRLVRTFGARVSVELHTDLAQDVHRTIAYARRFHAIAPDRFIIKVPLTPAGYVSVRRLSAEGIPVNYTLGFGARQNYLAAAFSRPAFVNVFLGRLNSVVADHALGDGKNVGEKATLATQRALCDLRDRGAAPTRLIAASMRQGPQVASLAGCDVFTMPTKVAAEFEADPVQVRSCVDDDPTVRLADGVSPDDVALDTLWDVPDAFRHVVDQITADNPDALDPDGLVDRFAGAGLGGLLPRWTADELATIREDGKIPNLDRWRDRLAAGDLGLDALMNISALVAFQVDQEAMDTRIRGML